MNRHLSIAAKSVLSVAGLTAGLLVVSSAAAFADEPQFNRDIRPILVENCFDCHGPDAVKRKSGLRLDLRNAAITGGEADGPAIVPGKPDESALIERIKTTDINLVMPPPKTGKKLDATQQKLLADWVTAGAKYEGHWAFSPPVKSATNTSQHPIDEFVARRLSAEGLTASPEADRSTLLRRLSLDLTGVTPTPQEQDAFLADASADAYERLVDRLMASPRFGEKWARHWLDTARYADSDGYEKDLPRNQWAWRDWVINAINADMPYNKFLIEQLAGDLLPNATQDQRIATGFLRNGMVNEEGAILFEQFRMEGMFDRMDVVGKSLLGLTIQCAQCHTHKFDPLQHDEYFQLLAFMNNDYESTQWVYNRDQLAVIDRLAAERAAIEARIRAEQPDWQAKLTAWLSTLPATTAWQVLDCSEHEWIGGLAHPGKLPDGSILTLGFRPTNGELFCVAEPAIARPASLRLEAMTHGDLPFNGPGRSYRGQFAISEIVVEAQPKSGGDWKPVPLKSATADFEVADQQLDVELRSGPDDKRRIGPASFLIDANEATAWGTDRGAGRRNANSTVVLQFGDFEWPAEGARIKVWLKYRHGGSDAHGRHNNFLGRFRLSVTDSTAAIADPVPELVHGLAGRSVESFSPQELDAAFTAWRKAEPLCANLNAEIEKVWSQYPEADTTILALQQRKPEDARPTAVLDRGAWDKPATTVTAGTPAFLHPLPEELRLPGSLQPKQADRLTLARWLTDRKSPTTARVFVNRVWQAMFGLGLVESADDFGLRSPLPTHPEVLDWLSVEFMDRGWSLKQLIKSIVMSKTYRQSSVVTPQAEERDPRNLLLARGPRFRVDAEVVRDISLAAAGMLNERIGGRSFFPPMPQSTFALSYLAVNFWETAPAPERYRRSLYMFRRRSMPDPVMAAFDAPNGDISCPKRPRSNTPLAALTSLNEPVFVDASRGLGSRILREGGSTDESRIRYGFRLCTGRVPTKDESETLQNFMAAIRPRIADGWLSPNAIATGDGNQRAQLPENVTPADLAVWTLAARVLLNLDETVNKN